MAAAERLFLERGYGPTTMASIAQAAEVSIETIYLSIGGKADLVKYLVEMALSGTDKPVPALQREGVREVRAEPDPRRKLQLFSRMVRALLERLAPIWQVLVQAAPTDPEVSSLIDQLLERHARTMRLVVEHLAETGTLRPDLSLDIARDVVWAMNSPEFYRLFVMGRGWTGGMFESWLADAWQRLLLDGEPASSGRMKK